MNRRVIIDWLRQPTSIAGISTLIGILAGLIARQLTLPQAVPLLAGAISAVILPDNSGAGADAVSLSRVLIAKITKHGGETK